MLEGIDFRRTHISGTRRKSTIVANRRYCAIDAPFHPDDNKARRKRMKAFTVKCNSLPKRILPKAARVKNPYKP